MWVGHGAPLGGIVSSVEPTRGQTHVTIDLGGVAAMVVLSSKNEVEEGDTMTVHTNPRQTYVFGAQSTERVSRN